MVFPSDLAFLNMAIVLSIASTSRSLSKSESVAFWSLAAAHGVLPTVAAKIRSLEGTEQSSSGPRPLPKLARSTRDRLLARTAKSMAIRHQASELCLALASAEVHATVLKGPDFADRLYPNASLRCFGDLDILTPISCLSDAGKVFAELGYARDVYRHRLWRSI